jgi:hypothetical protein
MNYTCRFHPLTKQDYDEAYEWYEDRQKGLGERFLEAVRNKIEEILFIRKPMAAKAIKNSEKQR